MRTEEGERSDARARVQREKARAGCWARARSERAGLALRLGRVHWSGAGPCGLGQCGSWAVGEGKKASAGKKGWA